MNKDPIKTKVKIGLSEAFVEISDHIKAMTDAGRYANIEKIFCQSLFGLLGSQAFRERTLKSIGAKTFKVDAKKDGRPTVDIALGDSSEGPFHTAFELKAVRMPRKKMTGESGLLFDIGQLAVDYLRLASAKKCDSGWLIAYVYGPMVDDATSHFDLYRRFHNQMYLDYALCDDECVKPYKKCFKKLGWIEPIAFAAVPKNAFAVLYLPKGDQRALGAIGYAVT